MNKVISLFAGAGGLDYGFKKAGFDIVWANEIDEKASLTHKLNFPKTKLITKDITKLKKTEIPKADIILAGFPCQPFSIAGYRKGFKDKRGNLFFSIIDILKISKPKILVLENVKNLEKHDNGNTLKTIIELLEKEGYKIKHKVLNTSLITSTPQNRERIFIIAFKQKKHFAKFEFPKPKNLKHNWRKILENKKVDSKYNYLNKQNKYHRMINEAIKKDPDGIFQIRRIYIRKNKKNIFPTLTANMGMGGHNVPIIKDNFGIVRKLTPRECFTIQGFPKNFKLPEKNSDSWLYKQAGNAVSATLSFQIAKSLLVAIK